jgi:hypothetical protein
MYKSPRIQALPVAEVESMTQQKGLITDLYTFHCATFVDDDVLASIEYAHSAVCSHYSLVLNSDIYHTNIRDPSYSQPI